MTPLKTILLKLHPDFNGGDDSLVAELQKLLAERRERLAKERFARLKICSCGCSVRLTDGQVKKGQRYATRLCFNRRVFHKPLRSLPPVNEFRERLFAMTRQIVTNHLLAGLLGCLLLVLTGCNHDFNHGLVTLPPVPDINPLHAVSGLSLVVSSQSNQGADTFAPPKPLTISWQSNQPGDAIVTGLQGSYDLVNWTTLCETNPFEDCTNYFVIQPTAPMQFFRTYNRPE